MIVEVRQEPAAWHRIPGAGMLQNWSAELKAACAKRNDIEWQIVGRAVIVISDDIARIELAVRQVASEASMNFLKVDADDVIDLGSRTVFRGQAPGLLYLEPGDWLKPKQDADSEEWAEKKHTFQKSLAKWIRDFEPEKPIVLVTSCLNMGVMSSVIDRPGCFDRYFVMPEVPFTQRGEEFIEDLGGNLCGETLKSSVEKLGKLVARSFSSNWRRDNALIYLQRLQRRENRPIEFADLMHVSLRGFAESIQEDASDDRLRQQVAVHEAGHAVMAIMDSDGKDMPDYCSIMPGANFTGVMAPSVDYYQSLEKCTSYSGFLHDVRVSLAGRAAEELVFGARHITSGCAGDLESAWMHSFNAFAEWGFAPGMDQDNQRSSSNLAVVVGKPTESEYAYVENLIRTFLAEEYLHTLAILSQNRRLLDAVAERLQWDPIVDQNELADIYQQHFQNAAMD